MKLAKSMSMLEVDARQNREVDMGLVEEEDVEEVDEQMVIVMCRCGWGGWSLLTMGRGPGGSGLCYHVKWFQDFIRWVFRDGVVLKSLGCHVVASMHGRRCSLSSRS